MNTQAPAATVREIGNHVGGKLVSAASERRQDVFNPASGTVTARVVLFNRTTPSSFATELRGLQEERRERSRAVAAQAGSYAS